MSEISHSVFKDKRSERRYPREPLSPNLDRWLRRHRKQHERTPNKNKRRNGGIQTGDWGDITYMATTAEPEQETPTQELPHGSPPLGVHPESCRGLFKEAYSTPRA
ncbi:hypothetical protein BHE74_00055683 [Ensete ventricosum]|nr:hypothetical protein GW17_00015719 [Ensete ventricosum]RWW39027.1 hypothetical protein BHE74_00055683 [Ensete ventricosum]